MNNLLTEETMLEILKVKEDRHLFKRESQTLEFKESFNFNALADFLRDFAAFANNKGGYLVFGVKDNPRILKGLSSNSKEQFNKIDPEKISEAILNCFSINIDYEMQGIEKDTMFFGFFYIHPSAQKPVICQKNEGRDQILKNGDIYYRYGGRTQKIMAGELQSIIEARIQSVNQQWIKQIQKIGTIGINNAQILDSNTGIIENGNRRLVIDESLIPKIKWIKEGDFHEKAGAETLRLVGTVEQIEKIEVERRVEEDIHKNYPLSASELWSAVKELRPNIRQPDFYRIIKDNEIKSNAEYARLVFRNQSQQNRYQENGILDTTIPVIYKQKTINFIVAIYDNELH
jgi:hypothetical protein